ncbi:N-acetylglucosamine-6-phosphate deacetylase [Paracoccaceae bacterium GXU_MW_L88]
MSRDSVTFHNGRIFDGNRLRDGVALRFEHGRATALRPAEKLDGDGEIIDLAGGILTPGYFDLQVNGGDGVMFNDDPSVDVLRRIAAAHRRLGVKALLPTLITDTAEKTRAAIAAATDAVAEGVCGIAGLHLEGPHLSIARKGAHDPALIRPMEAADLDAILTAAQALPALKVTIAPENVTEDQVRAMASAGVIVSLGHSDADYATCRRYFAAGARCVTHLFNAMSQLGNREPGLVGAALADGAASAGLIADTVHVHPESIRTAWAAKRGPGRIFLVSDAMAVAGTDETSFTLTDRRISRKNGVLTLPNGTLAGADLDLTTAIRVMVETVGIPLDDALRAATSTPAALIGRPLVGPDAQQWQLSKMIRIAPDLSDVKALR